MRVAVSRDAWERWMPTVAEGEWMVRPGRLEGNVYSVESASKRFDKCKQ